MQYFPAAYLCQVTGTTLSVSGAGLEETENFRCVLSPDPPALRVIPRADLACRGPWEISVRCVPDILQECLCRLELQAGVGRLSR